MTVQNMHPPSGSAVARAVAGRAEEEAAVQEVQGDEFFDEGDVQQFTSLDTESQNPDGGAEPPLLPMHLHARCYRFFIRQSQEWPRLFAIVFKVAIPLSSLILLSILFGYWLALLEAPGEIEKNNLVIASQTSLYFAARVERFMMREGPLFCMNLYFDEKVDSFDVDAVDDWLLEKEHEFYMKVYTNSLGENVTMQSIPETESSADVNETTGVLQGDIGKTNMSSIDDIPYFMEFVTKCGARIDTVVNKTSVSSVINRDIRYGIAGGSVTFNWIQCPPRQENEVDEESAREGTWKSWMLITETLQLSQVKEQESIVMRRWRENHYILFEEYFYRYLLEDKNLTRLEARDRAIEDAFLAADGFEGCKPDTASAAWFWFVVMTTVGYGNASPASTGGRAMVYTFGFICILVFATVLGNAGDIITTMFRDSVGRNKRLKWLSVAWVELVFWAVLFYVWLCVLAALTIIWKKHRAGEVMDFSVAFWFSFISITTVGLGDYYIDDDVIPIYDVVVIAILFLVGFVLAANFLYKLTEVLKDIQFRVGATTRAELERNQHPPPGTAKKSLDSSTVSQNQVND